VVALGRFGIAAELQVGEEQRCCGEAEGYASRDKDATQHGSVGQTIAVEVIAGETGSEEGDCSTSSIGEWNHLS
jgi:hypothetical protein